MRVNPVSASAPMDLDSDNETFEENPTQRSYTVSTLSPSAMTRGNAAEAIKTRKRAAADHGLDSDALPTDDVERFIERFHLTTTHSTNQGLRPSNEDVHIDLETPLGRLLGVFDGHGVFDKKRVRTGEDQDGLKVAKIAAESAKTHLIPLLNSKNFQTKLAAEAWAEMTHPMIPKIIAGTTVAMAFIERINAILHVINIGDSKIVVLRKYAGRIYAIPMSPVINWSTPECMDRVQEILSPEEFALWSLALGKHRRFPLKGGVNLSNSLGDHLMTYKGQTALTHEPFCSQLQLWPGDRILCGCDGFFDDDTTLQEIETLFEPYWDNPDADFAQIAAQYALNVKKSTDNVTVIAAKMALGPEPEVKKTKTVPVLDGFY